ncbi:hypothetical protein ARUE_c09080 [Arthrobacter sp. Rue61a]|nr:hypothetical protein ARUE_c09080 [Arthrobacter sp. Rue61a]
MVFGQLPPLGSLVTLLTRLEAVSSEGRRQAGIRDWHSWCRYSPRELVGNCFLPRDDDFMPSSSGLSYLVEEIGELWNATWFAALTEEIIDAIEQPFGEPEIGIISYWADSIKRPLPASSDVTVRKTANGMLAQVHDMGSRGAITYSLKVKQI